MHEPEDTSTPGTGASTRNVTQLFVSWRRGEAGAFEQLFAQLYEELRVLARRQRSRARPSETLRTTALVHETYLRLLDSRQVDVVDRAHFLALAARAMRNVLVDYARHRATRKRGGVMRRVELEEGTISVEAKAHEVLAVDSALAHLEELDARQAQVVEMRVFGGLSVEEAATVLAVSPATVKRDWQKARMYLARELGSGATA